MSLFRLKGLTRILLLAVLTLPVIGRPSYCADPPGMLEFVQQRSARTWPQVPRKVLAFYYTWYGTPERHGRWVHWGKVDPQQYDISASTHYPALGAYDSYDPQVIDAHIDMAQQHGVDGFICTWWGRRTFDDRALGIVLERAKAKNFTVTIYWETAPGSGPAQVDRAVDDLLYVLRKYGSHPSFLKVDGRPVIFVYGRVMNEVAMQQWPAIITEVERQYPAGCLLIADGYRSGYARVFDGIHTYNICGWVRGNEGADLRELSRSRFTESVQLAKKAGKIACITIIPGYDDTKIRTPGLVAKREDGQTYKVLWEEAIAADPDWILITSWNEWHEGSEIEPSREHGEMYLDMTGRYAREFKQTPFSRVPVGNRLAGLSADKKQKLQQLFRDRPIAILPGYDNEVVFWLAEAGVPLYELTAGAVVSAETLTAERFPILLYAGFENYRQTVENDRDVDRHVLRYLREGGLLLAMPSGPFPLYYNEQRETVNSAARFGLPVGAGTGNPAEAPTGWETPPSGLELTFRLQTDLLPSVPATVRFPDQGDQRWRPMTQRTLAEDDIYIPLATLKDQTGRNWGDAIAYVEHRVSEPQGGKGLYVWMRMPDVVSRDRLLFDLLQFAAQRSRQ
jgi:hypothetical protein